MPSPAETCGILRSRVLRHAPAIADEDITEPHQPIDDTQAHPPITPPPAGPPPGAPPPEDGPPPGPPPPGRDVWPWLAALGILAIAGLLLWLFVFRDTSKGKIVPAVVGLQQQQAVEELTKEGFAVQVIVAPSAKSAGIVFSQKPGGGSRLDRGQTVVIHVSNGHPLTDTTTSETTTTTAAPTTTAEQTTTASQTTTKETTTTAPPTASVPDVTGQQASDAAGQIEAAGFVAQTDPVDQSGTAGSVVGQSPAGKSNAPIGSVVRLSVATRGSDRPAQQVPNVVGQKAAAARAALLDAKFTVKTVNKKASGSSRGAVLAQSPVAGDSQPAYTQVTITVGE
jgi:beta-lactam-binding protein with PASTA domain